MAKDEINVPIGLSKDEINVPIALDALAKGEINVPIALEAPGWQRMRLTSQ